MTGMASADAPFRPDVILGLTPRDLALFRQADMQLAAKLDVPVIEIEGPWPMEWYADAALKELGL